MLVWALMFSLIALVAGVLGLSGIAGAAGWLAWFTLGLCLVLFIVMLIASLFSPRPQTASYTEDVVLARIVRGVRHPRPHDAIARYEGQPAPETGAAWPRSVRAHVL